MYPDLNSDKDIERSDLPAFRQWYMGSIIITVAFLCGILTQLPMSKHKIHVQRCLEYHDITLKSSIISVFIIKMT